MYIYIYSNPQKDRKVKYGTIFLQNSEVYGTSVFLAAQPSSQYKVSQHSKKVLPLSSPWSMVLPGPRYVQREN